MSKVLRVIAVVAAVVAIVASLAVTFGASATILGMSLATIASVASAVSAVAGALAQATMKPPDMKGTVSQVVIGKNLPIIYAMGLTYVGGMMVYDKSANGVDNYDRTQIMVGTAAGPIEGFQKFYGDFDEITFASMSGGLISGKANGFYGADGGYLWLNSRKGARPETALTASSGRAALSEWGSDYKLSGWAAWSVTMEFDEDGVRYSGGIPQWGMLAKWVKIYDPRKDSTYPGGSGSHRWDDEDTFEYGSAGSGTVAIGENPALHALTYARGRFIEKDAGGSPLAEPVKICGIGLPQDAIRVSDFVTLANICDANGWTCGGAVYEGPGTSEWDNLKRILQAAGAEPVWSGGSLSLKWSAPRTPVFTITANDLADGDIEMAAMKPWRERINTIVPRVRLTEGKWEYEQLEEVQNATYLAEDGEQKTSEVQFDLVQDADQGAQLAALQLANGREFGPLRIPLKPAFMVYRPGEVGTVNLGSLLNDDDLGEQLCVITGREIDPTTGAVVLTLESETVEKYDWALTQEGVPPPTPTIISSQEIDEAVSGDTLLPSDAATIEQVEWSDRLVMRTTPIPRATSYRWRFYLSDGTTLKRTITTAIPQVEYTKAQAHFDGISRSYKVDVAGVNANGTGTALMSSTLTKTAPAAPTSVTFADGTSTSTVTFTPPSGEVAGYRIAYSTASGFDPMTQGASFTAGGSPAYTPQLPAATYYGKVAAFDLWSSQASALTFSSQDSFVITPGSGGSPPPGDGGGGGLGGGGIGGGINEY